MSYKPLAATLALEDAPALLTVQQAASILAVDPNTVHRQCHAGSIPYVTVGRAIRIPREAIRKLIARAAV